MDVRLILDPPAAGSVNMAIDDALLESASRGETVLRFYAWQPATLSLGYFQGYRERDQHAASGALDVVRRGTGGGAIVHDLDLTYSFVTPISQRFSADHQQLVQTFHHALCETLGNWGLIANLYGTASPRESPGCPPATKPFLCFQRRSAEDVVIRTPANDGPKIAGTAQRRRRHALLQHGSVLLAASRHAPELLGIGDVAASCPPTRELIDAWSDGVARRLGVRLVRGEVTEQERRSAQDHQASRYDVVDWQKRR